MHQTRRTPTKPGELQPSHRRGDAEQGGSVQSDCTRRSLDARHRVGAHVVPFGAPPAVTLRCTAWWSMPRRPCARSRLAAWADWSHGRRCRTRRVIPGCALCAAGQGLFEHLLPPPLGLADQRAPRVAAGAGCRRGRGREVPHWQAAPRPANPWRPAASSTAGVLPDGEGRTAPYGVMACLPRPRHRGAGREGSARFQEAASRNRTRSPRRNR
jgi:hypothetical protein